MKTITILLLFTLSFMACHNATPKATKQEVFKKDTIPKKAISVDWYIKKFHDTIIHSPHDTLHLFIRVFASVTSGEHTIDERIYDSITFDNELNSGGQTRNPAKTSGYFEWSKPARPIRLTAKAQPYLCKIPGICPILKTRTIHDLCLANSLRH